MTVSKSIKMFAFLMLLSSCATTGPAIDRGTVCAGWKPVFISKDDVLTKGTAEAILAHNVFGQKQGCW